MRRAVLALLALAPAVWPVAASAGEADLTVSDAWMRVIVPSRPAAGYFTVSNKADVSVDLTAVSSPACASVMLHRSMEENGVGRMMMIDKVPVPAKGSVAFEPGGYHLMCMSPSSAMAPGASVPVTLTFSSGATLTSDFAVKGAAGQ
jgi:periplasmic copper chaperone A